MGVITYFFDSYAFFEVFLGNKNFSRYGREGVGILTSQLNLMELHYGLIRLYGNKKADDLYDNLNEFVIAISDDIIKRANYFRFLHKDRNLSYVDCVGYILALSRNVKFLTGDKQFKDLPNVEFVK